MVASKRDRIIEWVRWGLTALVIPLAIWGVKLEVNNAVQNERISELQKLEKKGSVVDGRLETLGGNMGVQEEQIKRLQDDLKEAQRMRAAIQANTVALGRLEVKIDAVYNHLNEITRILRAP